MKSARLSALFFLLLASVASTSAADLVNKSFFGNVAVDGYDVVAYFTDHKPVKGDKNITLEHDGAVYRFTSAKHRAMFESDPEAYLPAYGGFCAWAIAQGNTADIDPEAWTIYDGRLYLNYNKKVQATWMEDVPGNISQADIHWPEIVAKKSR